MTEAERPERSITYEKPLPYFDLAAAIIKSTETDDDSSAVVEINGTEVRQSDLESLWQVREALVVLDEIVGLEAVSSLLAKQPER